MLFGIQHFAVLDVCEGTYFKSYVVLIGTSIGWVKACGAHRNPSSVTEDPGVNIWGPMTRFMHGHGAVQIKHIYEACVVFRFMNGWIVCYKGAGEGNNIISSPT